MNAIARWEFVSTTTHERPPHSLSLPLTLSLTLYIYIYVLTARKINLVICLTYRALMICSDSRIESKIKKVTDIFLLNGYPDNVSSNSMGSTIEKCNTCKSFGPLKCPVYSKLPWIGPVRLLFADNISKAVTRCFYSA